MFTLLEMAGSMAPLLNTYVRYLKLARIFRRLVLVDASPWLHEKTANVATDEAHPQVLLVTAINSFTFATLLRALRVSAEHAGGLFPLFVADPVESMAAKNS